MVRVPWPARALRSNRPKTSAAFMDSDAVEPRPSPSIFSKSDLTPPHEVSLQGPIETLHGKPPTASSLRIGPGCGLPRPSVGEIGVFFVERWSGEVSPWYFDTRQHPRIDDIIERLNRSAAPKPAAELTPGNSMPRRSGTRPFR